MGGGAWRKEAGQRVCLQSFRSPSATSTQQTQQQTKTKVRGVDALKAFGVNLLAPYAPPAAASDASQSAREAALEAEVKALKARVAELEAQLARR